MSRAIAVIEGVPHVADVTREEVRSMTNVAWVSLRSMVDVMSWSLVDGRLDKGAEAIDSTSAESRPAAPFWGRRRQGVKR